ncbi:MAG: hypothetical protein ACKPKE_24075 [Microcystis panniformis]
MNCFSLLPTPYTLHPTPHILHPHQRSPDKEKLKTDRLGDRFY